MNLFPWEVTLANQRNFRTLKFTLVFSVGFDDKLTLEEVMSELVPI